MKSGISGKERLIKMKRVMDIEKSLRWFVIDKLIK
jgi:hypothetical protein